MKRFLVLLMALCMLASVLCVTATAAETYVMRVTGLREDDTVYYPENCGYKDFAEGWDAAVNYALNEEWMDANDVVRVVVDFFFDWKANDDGEFGKSSLTGFQYSTIYVPGDTRITINLNGHTINRDLKEKEYDGEVIYVSGDADLIINGGTIKGGWSRNGAGGIHVKGGANLTLNNVTITENKAEIDDGGGIAVYSGASLTVNGGSISNNEFRGALSDVVYGGGVYLEKCTAKFSDVTFENNHSNGAKEFTQDDSATYSCIGAALYAYDSTVTIDSCRFYENGRLHGNVINTRSVISVSDDSEMTVKNTIFERNGDGQRVTNGRTSEYLDTNLFSTYRSKISLENCQFYNNYTGALFSMDAKSTLIVTNTMVKHNSSAVYTGAVSNNGESVFTNCTFDNNTNSDAYPYIFEFSTTQSNPIFVDCEFGNSSFNDRSRATFVETPTPETEPKTEPEVTPETEPETTPEIEPEAEIPPIVKENSEYKFIGLASIFGEGSPAMIVAILALIASVVSICLTVSYNKKKTDPANTAEPKNEE